MFHKFTINITIILSGVFRILSRGGYMLETIISSTVEGVHLPTLLNLLVKNKDQGGIQPPYPPRKYAFDYTYILI